MPIDTLDILGSDQIGIHLSSVGNVLFHPRELPEVALEQLETALQLEMAPISIGGSNLIGALLAGNSNGIAVADIATEKDIDQLTAYGDVVVMEGGVNTAGNLLLANEQGCVAPRAFHMMDLRFLLMFWVLILSQPRLADKMLLAALEL